MTVIIEKLVSLCMQLASELGDAYLNQAAAQKTIAMLEKRDNMHRTQRDESRGQLDDIRLESAGNAEVNKLATTASSNLQDLLSELADVLTNVPFDMNLARPLLHKLFDLNDGLKGRLNQ